MVSEELMQGPGGKKGKEKVRERSKNTLLRVFCREECSLQMKKVETSGAKLGLNHSGGCSSSLTLSTE